MGSHGRVMLTYDEAEYTEKSILIKKIASTIELGEGETFKSIRLSLFDQDESDLNYPKLFSINLTGAILLDDLANLNLSMSLINEAIGILPKISSRNLTFLRVVDDRPLIEFESDSREVFTSFGHNLAQVLTLNLTLIHFRSNISVKGKIKFTKAL